MLNQLFVNSPDGVVPILNAYALATLIRTLHYEDQGYRRKWLEAVGFSNVTCTRDESGFPAPYAIARSPDGIVIAIDGIQNFFQAMGYMSNAVLVDYYEAGGQVNKFCLDWALRIRTALLALVNGSPYNQKIVIAGYSAGGAVAAIFARILSQVLGAGRVVYGMSFGSPKPGDYDFASTVGAPWYSFEGEEDMVCGFPLYTARYQGQYWLPTGVCFPVRCGQCVYLYRNGNVSWNASTWSRGPATPNILLKKFFGAEPALGTDHVITAYIARLEANIGNGSWDFADKLKVLNYAMDAGLSPVDNQTPVAADPTTPVVSPNLPTMIEAASIPSNDLNPSNPTPPTFDTSFASNTARTIVKVKVSDAIEDDAPLELRGRDRRLVNEYLTIAERINKHDGRLLNQHRFRTLRSSKRLVRRMLSVFDKIIARDAKAANPKPTEALSTRAFIFDMTNADIASAVANIKGALEARLVDPDRSKPIINRVGSTLENQDWEFLSTELTLWFMVDALSEL